MEVSDTLLRSFKARRMTDAEIASATGLPVADVRERVRQVYAAQNGGFVPGVDPTPEEIAERAAIERAKWSPAEEIRRRGGVCEWTPPDADMDLCRRIASPPSRW